MKKLVTTGIALVMALMLPFSAYAMEVPTGTVIQNLNGVQQYIKTYTVSAGTDPQELIEEPFDYEGFTYRYASITKAENEFDDEKQQTETVTVETDKKDLSVVLDALPVSVEYDDGQYVGTLYLDHPYNTIYTNEHYYLVCALANYENISLYRIDRMKDLTITDEAAQKGIESEEFTQTAIYAFAGKPEPITFAFDKIILNDVIDRFGSAIEIKPNGDKCTARIMASPRGIKFWALQYLPYVEVLTPSWLRNEIVSSIAQNPYIEI